MSKTKEKVHITARIPKELKDFAQQLDPENLNEDIIKAILFAKEHLEKSIVSSIRVRPLINEQASEDFEGFACPFRKPHDATTYTCYSRTPLVRVLHDGIVPKDICRICEKKGLEEDFLKKEPLTESGRLFKQFIINDRERKRQERLEYFKEKEHIKTEAIRERQKIKDQNRRAKVNWDDGDPHGTSFDSSALDDGYSSY